MQPEEIEAIRSIIPQLEAVVPQSDRQLILKQIGSGPDEAALIGNRAGYVALALELLKAGVEDVPEGPQESTYLTTSIKRVLSDRSDVFVHDLLLDDSGALKDRIAKSVSPERSPRDVMTVSLYGIVALLVLWAAVVGAITLAGDFARLMH